MVAQVQQNFFARQDRYVLDIWYSLKDSRVVVRIKLKSIVERMLNMDGSPKDPGN